VLSGNKRRIHHQQQQMIKIHSHCLSHSHQLHTPQSDIAQLPIFHWMMHGGEVCHQPATKPKLVQLGQEKAELGLNDPSVDGLL
jgi:hypothetical protein